MTRIPNQTQRGSTAGVAPREHGKDYKAAGKPDRRVRQPLHPGAHLPRDLQAIAQPRRR
jgi:hypothetical protein